MGNKKEPVIAIECIITYPDFKSYLIDSYKSHEDKATVKMCLTKLENSSRHTVSELHKVFEDMVNVLKIPKKVVKHIVHYFWSDKVKLASTFLYQHKNN